MDDGDGAAATAAETAGRRGASGRAGVAEAIRPPAAPARYDRTAVALHALLAVLIVASLLGGLYMTGLPLSPRRLRLFNWHKWAGVVVLGLSALRLAWRLAHPPPPLPASSAPRWQRGAATAVHRALYALFLAVPLAGWAYSSAAGFPVVLFGIWPLPDWVPADRALAASLKTLHHWLAWALGALAALHVAAALKHHVVDRDGLLRRMAW